MAICPSMSVRPGHLESSDLPCTMSCGKWFGLLAPVYAVGPRRDLGVIHVQPNEASIRALPSWPVPMPCYPVAMTMPSSLGRAALSLSSCLLILLAWLLTAMPGALHAQGSEVDGHDGVTHRSWLDDPDGTFSPQDVLGRSWRRFDGPLSRGFTRSTTWVRLTIDPAAAGPASLPSDRRLVLRILPGHLDDVTVYRVDRLSHSVAQVGDLFPSAERARFPQGLLHYGVVFDEADSKPFEVLLRLRSQSNHSMHVLAQRWDEARDATAWQQAVVYCYLVFIGMVVGWAALAWLERYDGLLGLFVIYQVSAALVAATLLGVLRLHGPQGLAAGVNALTSMAIAGSSAVSLIFHARLLADLGARRGDWRLIMGLGALPVLALLMIVAGRVMEGLRLTHLSLLVAMPLVIGVAYRAQPEQVHGGAPAMAWRRVFVTGVYAALTALMLPQSLRVLGLLPAGPWSYGAYFVHGVAGSALLAALLVLRAREARRRRVQQAQVLARVQQDAEAQRARATEQAELMDMLTHELKTPLSVVSLALGGVGMGSPMHERALRAVRNMRDVIDRCAQAALADEATAQPRRDVALTHVAIEVLLDYAVGVHLQAARVSCRAEGALPLCLSDEQMLLAIVSNLLDNALKYSLDDSIVRLSARATHRSGRQGVVVCVVNEVGVAGRPDETRLFEKYHRGERARHRSGSGLGLYLSNRLAARIGAELRLRPEGGSLVCFELWVPASASAPAVT